MLDAERLSGLARSVEEATGARLHPSGYSSAMRPMTFWALVAGAIFAAMTVLWAFGDEPTGAVFVISSVAWWGSALMLVFLGLVAISRFGREPVSRRRGPSRSGGEPRPGGTSGSDSASQAGRS